MDKIIMNIMNIDFLNQTFTIQGGEVHLVVAMDHGG